MPDFGDAERRILSYFVKGRSFLYKGQEYSVVEADKPTCSSGEPKTDIYVLADSASGQEEIKISYKKENADFLENKIGSERAEQIFGPNWSDIIATSTKDIRDKFLERALIYKTAFRRTCEGAITLGWKFELVNKLGGELSGRMNLSQQQVYDVYAGTNLGLDKRDAYVHDRAVKNSGIANNILMTNQVNSIQDIIDKMIPIKDYICVHPDIYFACKALNYRTFEQKYDGNRPLAVQVNWEIENRKLTPHLLFDAPLKRNGLEMANQLLHCMKRLHILTTDDINSSNADMRSVHE